MIMSPRGYCGGDLGAENHRKICPYSGKPGSVIYETKERIVFEGPNGHRACLDE